MKQFVNEYDEALDAITCGQFDISDIEPYIDAIAGALKKQIPVSPESTKLVANMKYWYRCPICHNGITKYHPHCGSCGQYLDWEDV